MLHDTDFYRWTKEQAEALRAEGRRRQGSNAIEWEQVAEEVEDMGKSDLREALSRTRTILEHLYKLAAATRAGPLAGWKVTIKTQRADLRQVLTASIRAKVESNLDALHTEAADIAATSFEAEEPGAVIEATRRWTLPQILGEENDPLA
jgi:hypothetical protein